MTSIGSGGTTQSLYYDSSDRNWGLEQISSSGNGTAAYYGRDVQGRISYRNIQTITGWSWHLDTEQWYGFTGSGGGPSFVRDANWDIVEKYISLPGGVRLTIRPPQTGNANKVYSLSNIQGSVTATTDASGTLMGTFAYDPFGNKTSSALPDNTGDRSSFGYAGSHAKITEASMALNLIHMRVRVYLSSSCKSLAFSKA